MLKFSLRAIWRGYKEIKDHGGWACLVFAGMGIYRFCKYRIGFDPESMAILRRTRARFEVAADTMVRLLLPYCKTVINSRYSTLTGETY